MRSARQAFTTSLRGLILSVGGLVLGLPLLIFSILTLVLLPLSLLFRKPLFALSAVRWTASQYRELAEAWTGVRIETPYRRSGSVLRDPATWRDLLWVLVAATVGFVVGLLPAALLLDGIGSVFAGRWFWWYIDGIPSRLVWAIPVLGALAVLISVKYGSLILRGHALLSASLLSPTREATAARVAQLTESRAQAVDTSAAELRRIERDLHDGVQVRIAALGLNIGLAEQLLRDDPDKALELLVEARESSNAALAELRGLVRGIHPPVLAERGLDGAVRALALSLPLPVEVDSEPAARFADPIESAVYFGVAEALANVIKHSGATRAWVRLRHGGGVLTAAVTDNGIGGAGVESGGGLDGIRQRLAAFDGTIVVKSDPGGPTFVRLEVPCDARPAT
jgi:signal transduction histidine kinase